MDPVLGMENGNGEDGKPSRQSCIDVSFRGYCGIERSIRADPPLTTFVPMSAGDL
jgi:hypothetical protein